jgi:lactate permease
VDSSVGLWLLAVSPVVVLLVLVLVGIRTGRAAGIVFAWVVVLGWLAFGAPADLLALATGKGLWLGVWILCVVWPALLLYRLASTAGLERIGRIFTSVLPRRRENLLIVAWIFPSFIQGIAGFGTPIAVAAPLLLAMGWSKSRAVIYPLIGYHWAVTFGSMGSSFYMASLTARLSAPDEALFALFASSFLAVNCLLAGALVLLLDGGWAGLKEGWRVLLAAGIPMGATLILVAGLVPAVASLAAGTAGLLAVTAYSAWMRRSRRVPVGTPRRGAHEPEEVPADVDRPVDAPVDASAEVQDEVLSQTDRERPVALLSPYLYLLALALPVFLWPTSREWIQQAVVLGFDFPATATGRGWTNPAVTTFNPIRVFAHPGFYILLAVLTGYLTYRATGLWRAGAGASTVRAWARSLPQASISVLLLAAVATVLVDTGMVDTLAQGIADVAGSGFPLLAPAVGAMGSFITGSTTSSNALFAALQAEVAVLVDLPAPVLLAAQTAGGNVGNAVAPVVILIGATAVDAVEESGRILRACLVPAAVLLVAVVLATLVVIL